MEPGAVGEAYVGVRGRVVEASSTRRRQPLGQAAHGSVVGEADVRASQPTTPVDPDVVRTVDEHVGDVGQPQQRLERSRAVDVLAQQVVDLQHRRVSDGRARGTQCFGDPVRREITGRRGEPTADVVDHRR